MLNDAEPITLLELNCAAGLTLEEWAALGAQLATQVAAHVTVRAWHSDLAVLEALCLPIATTNPLIHWDVILDNPRLQPAALRALRERWPHQIGYLDRVAVFRNPRPQPDWHQITPRCWMLADWDACDPLAFEGIAELVWRIDAQAWSAACAGLSSLPGTPVIACDLTPSQLALCAELDWHVLNG